MKKFASIIMVCAVIFTMAMPCFAAETIDTPETDEILVSGEITEEISTETVSSCIPETQLTQNEDPETFTPGTWGDRPVAKVYLCTTLNSLTGHIWLYFVNVTPYKLPLGYIYLDPYEEMSVGSLRNSRKDGGGTYYNGEAFMANDLASVCKHTTSISMDINYDQLITIGNKIKSKNSYILLGNNCGDFACACWNTIAPAGKKVINILVPLFTIINVQIAGGRKGQIEMKRPDISRVFKQVTNGVRQAVPESFKSSCVNW